MLTLQKPSTISFRTRPFNPMHVIATVDAPVSGVLELTKLNLNGYQRIIIALDNIVMDTDESYVTLNLYVGDSLVSSGYRSRTHQQSSSGSGNSTSSTSATELSIIGVSGAWAIGNASGENGFAWINLSNADNTNLYKLLWTSSHSIFSSGNTNWQHNGQILEQTGIVTGFKVAGVSGLISSGSMQIIGVRKRGR